MSVDRPQTPPNVCPGDNQPKCNTPHGEHNIETNKLFRAWENSGQKILGAPRERGMRGHKFPPARALRGKILRVPGM